MSMISVCGLDMNLTVNVIICLSMQLPMFIIVITAYSEMDNARNVDET